MGLGPGVTNSGSFKPGHKSNGGRPKGITGVKELARAHTAEAVATLASVMRDKDAPHSARVRASDTLLNRAWGTPETTSHVTIDRDVRELSTAEILAALAAVGAIGEEAGPDQPSSVH